MTDQPNDETFSATLDIVDSRWTTGAPVVRTEMSAAAACLQCTLSVTAGSSVARALFAERMRGAGRAGEKVRIDITFLGDDSTEATDTH